MTKSTKKRLSEEGTYLAVIYKDSEYDRYGESYDESEFYTVVANELYDLSTNFAVRQAAMSIVDRTVWRATDLRLFRSSIQTGKLRRILDDEPDFQNLLQLSEKETIRIKEEIDLKNAEVARIAAEESTRRAALAKRQAEANEKAEYERLKAKFGDK